MSIIAVYYLLISSKHKTSGKECSGVDLLRCGVVCWIAQAVARGQSAKNVQVLIYGVVESGFVIFGTP